MNIRDVVLHDIEKYIKKGGVGSGNFNHQGRKGIVGGSSKGGFTSGNDNQLNIKETKDVNSFINNIKKVPKGYGLSIYSKEEYKGMRLFLDSKNGIGAAVKSDGDIVSVFNNSKIRGAGRKVMEIAIKNGGNKLDCFDINNFLPDYYRSFGFKEYDKYKWNDKFAPENWDYKKNGRPNILLMRLETTMKKYDKNDRLKEPTKYTKEEQKKFDDFGRRYLKEVLGMDDDEIEQYNNKK